MGALFVISVPILVLVVIWFLAGVKVSMSAEQLNYTFIKKLGDGV